jgi:hypothetical protein
VSPLIRTRYVHAPAPARPRTGMRTFLARAGGYGIGTAILAFLMRLAGCGMGGPAAITAPDLTHVQLDFSCLYGGETDAATAEILDSDSAAHAEMSRIAVKFGLSPNFLIRAANVRNAAAVIDSISKQRLILYNPSFMRQAFQATGTTWAARSIVAHEMAHHLNGHTLAPNGNSHRMELEADSSSGWVVYWLGGTIPQASAALRELVSEHGSYTHPPRRERVRAVEAGWRVACFEDRARHGGEQEASCWLGTPRRTTAPARLPPPAGGGGAHAEPALLYDPSSTPSDNGGVIGRCEFFAEPWLTFNLLGDGRVMAVDGNGEVVKVRRWVRDDSGRFDWLYVGPDFVRYVDRQQRVWTDQSELQPWKHIGNCRWFLE